MVALAAADRRRPTQPRDAVQPGGGRSTTRRSASFRRVLLAWLFGFKPARPLEALGAAATERMCMTPGTPSLRPAAAARPRWRPASAAVQRGAVGPAAGHGGWRYARGSRPPGVCAPACRRWPSRCCASWAGPSLRQQLARRGAAARGRCPAVHGAGSGLGRGAGALRAVHAGQPGGRGRQAPADTRAQAAFINACLRRFLRERDALVARPTADPVARWNHPRWWIDRLQQDHPDALAGRSCEANNRHAPMTLRVNMRQTTTASPLASCMLAGIDAAAGRTQTAWSWRTPRRCTALPGFEDGAGFGAGRRRAAAPRRCCWPAWRPLTEAAARSGRLRRPGRQDRPPAGAAARCRPSSDRAGRRRRRAASASTRPCSGWACRHA